LSNRVSRLSRRYEQRSVVVTTNLLFKQWDTVFLSASCAVALIDRLTHPAETSDVATHSNARSGLTVCQSSEESSRG